MTSVGVFDPQPSIPHSQAKAACQRSLQEKLGPKLFRAEAPPGRGHRGPTELESHRRRASEQADGFRVSFPVQ